MTETIIQWPGLTPATLIRRYKRFMVDVRLDSGEFITAHCPNSGSMLSCLETGRKVFLSVSDNPGRKYPHTLEIIEMPSSLVVVNTLMANRIVKKTIASGIIPELSGYSSIRPEVPYGTNSRIDFLLGGREKPCFVEVKSCTLVRDGIAMFPDAVTRRGQKHLQELREEHKAGSRCVMFYLVQRMDGHSFRSAASIDPSYAKGLQEAYAAGVEILVYACIITPEGVSISGKLPFSLGSLS